MFSKALRPNDFTYGTQSSASKRFHHAVAGMWNECVLAPCTPTDPLILLAGEADRRNFSPLTPVQPDDIATAPGATGALDQLFSVLGDAGDAVLIAASQ